MRTSRGFTLIELLIVVVIIGILAAIAIPKFANTKAKAYIASEKADLRNLVTAQEAYFADNVTYASTTTNLSYNVSAGNTITITGSSGTGWSATSSNAAAGESCGIYVGTGTISGYPSAGEGAPACE